VFNGADAIAVITDTLAVIVGFIAIVYILAKHIR
jgi:hypothetical protein